MLLLGVSVPAVLLLGQGTPLCRGKDLTAVPDARFEQRAQIASAGGADAEKIVCLTFDDGPSGTTRKVLEVLAREQVPATFFVIAADNNREELPLVAEELEQGHQVALHTCSHDYRRIYASPEAYWQDIKELRRALSPYIPAEELGWLRFPGGSTNTVSHRYGGSDIMERLKQQAGEMGYRYIDWNLCAEDAAGGHPSPEQIIQNVVGDVGEKKTCVVLMHDTAATGNTAEALPGIIRWFRDRKFTFCTVEQMAEAMLK